MKLDHEQYEILMTSLQNYRGELYIDGSNSQAIAKVDKLCQDIEDEKESKEIKQEKIPVTKEMYGVTEVGSETGIEEYYHTGPKLCENCDE
jgi:hypothetical protein